MKLCETIEEGVRSAMLMQGAESDRAWSIRPAGEGDLTDTLILEGKEYPFLWWRSDPQMAKLRSLAPSRKPCSMKLNRSGHKSDGLDRVLYREIDVCRRTLQSDFKTVCCFRNGGAMSMLVTMENDRVALFELCAALNDGTEEQGRHTFWGENGMASDLVVSSKIRSQALYLYTEDKKDPELYNDLCLPMFGLDRTDAIKADCVAEILMGRVDPEEWIAADREIRAIMDAVRRSAESETRVAVKD